ncbi:MAG: glycosyltransferase family 39 protein [Acidobacteriota bacterium]
MALAMAYDPKAERRPLLALLAWAALLFSCGVWWGLPNSFTWAGDELNPSTWPQALDPRTPGLWDARYPPLQFALLQGISWPLRAAAEHGVEQPTKAELNVQLIYLSRGVSLVMALITLWFLYRAAREIQEPRAALWSVFILASVAPYVYYAKMANLDVPYVMWFTLSLWMFLRILKEHRLRDYVLFAAAAAAAVCTKDQAYGLYTLAPIPIAVSLWRRDYRGRENGPWGGIWRTLVDRRIWVAAGTAVVLFVVFQNLIFDFHRFQVHLRLLRGPMSENYQDYEGNVGGQMELLRTFLGLVGFSLNPVLSVACLAGLVMTFWRGRLATVAESAQKIVLLRSSLVLVLSYYFTFLVLILFCYDRYVLPVTVVLALFGGLALGAFTRPTGRWRMARWSLAAAVALYSALYAASVDFRLLADSRYHIEKWVVLHAKEPGSVMAIGRHHHVARFRWVTWERALLDDGEILRRERPEFVVLNLTDLRHPAEEELARRLETGEIDYRLALRYRGTPALDILPVPSEYSSARFINPEMAVYERVGPSRSVP